MTATFFLDFVLINQCVAATGNRIFFFFFSAYESLSKGRRVFPGIWEFTRGMCVCVCIVCTLYTVYTYIYTSYNENTLQITVKHFRICATTVKLNLIESNLSHRVGRPDVQKSRCAHKLRPLPVLTDSRKNDSFHSFQRAKGCFFSLSQPWDLFPDSWRVFNWELKLYYFKLHKLQKRL